MITRSISFRSSVAAAALALGFATSLTALASAAGAGGLSSAGARFLQQDKDGLGGVPEGYDIGGDFEPPFVSQKAGDHFGASLATGDFNGDGYRDLLVGVPNENAELEAANRLSAWEFPRGKGVFHVVYGGPGGLAPAASEIFGQDEPGVRGVSEQGDEWGFALAAGDFDGDGFDDAAVGIPGEALDTNVGEEGEVAIFFGGPQGLTVAGHQFWNQENLLIGTNEPNDRFGHSLAAGDFDADGFDDLAIGIPGENDEDGAVGVAFGSPLGVGPFRSQTWSQDTPGVPGSSDEFFRDDFGWAVAAGDFDADGFDDLAVGAPADENTGSVTVLPGSAIGPGIAGAQLWHQNQTDAFGGVAGGREPEDLFGFSLGVGDFDGDGFDDLAIGVPGEDAESGQQAKLEYQSGAVAILRGGASGLSTLGNQLWDQNSSDAFGNIEGGREEDDRFGHAVAAGDFDGDGFDDLAIGIPQEDDNAGGVAVLHGSDAGITSRGNQLWQQDSPGLGTVREEGDRMGYALATGDFDGDGADDLAAGAPGENEHSGIAHVLPGVVSRISVPDLVGLPLAEALDLAQGLGLLIGTLNRTFDDAPVDTVIFQDPPAGTQVEVGTELVLTVSRGPEPVEGDIDGDGDVDIVDLFLLWMERGEFVGGSSPLDLDADRVVTMRDARLLILRCTLPGCRTP